MLADMLEENGANGHILKTKDLDAILKSVSANIMLINLITNELGPNCLIIVDLGQAAMSTK